VRKAFRHIDVDFDGKVSVKEFRFLFNEYNINITDDTFRTILKKLGLNEHKDIMYDQFQSLFGETILGQDQTPMYTMLHGKEDENRRRSSLASRRGNRIHYVNAKTASKQLCEHLYRRYKTVRRAWRTIDTDHSNSVTKEEFRAALNDFNIQMRDDEFEKLVSNMSFGTSGTIEYDDFRRMFGRHIDNQVSPQSRGRKGSYVKLLSFIFFPTHTHIH